MRRLCPTCGAIVVGPCTTCRRKREQARDARKKIIRPGPARTTLARKAKARDGYQCQRCGVKGPPRNPAGPPLVAHHKVPLAYGGPNTLENMTTLCKSCHDAVESLTRQQQQAWDKAHPEAVAARAQRKAEAEEQTLRQLARRRGIDPDDVVLH